ncbi:phosphotransferase enzyme family protein [Microlunatus parietis]|uniref:Ser/Thr protein kinase RdoA (MazF antagonist) n=1 Tax=Microlunatus parietis TaxID=682979 RepID=A0A7Y9I9P1_9ACTN|nr:phosphotransferase [Microlunatus parietis]NYE72903.1 Ser/Thr protein kinase RdoA (MazF antagonist) [Microlunatus parietis]
MPAEVLAAFGLRSEQGWRLDHVRTLHNTVFSLRHEADPEPSWALRMHGIGWRTADEVRAELAMLEFLDQEMPQPFAVPRPRRTEAGDLVTEIDGSLYSLLGWVPGHAARPDTGLGVDAVRLLGRGLGALHTALDQWPGPAPVHWDVDSLLTDNAPGLMGKKSAILNDVLSAAELALFDEVKDCTRQVFDRSTDWGIIHADYILGNCHWSSDDGHQRLGILDFDDFGFGPRSYDFGAVLGNLRDFTESWPAHAAAFVAGYRTVRELSESVVATLPIMMAARHASMCLSIIGHTDLDRDHLRLRMQLARDCLAVDPAAVFAT